MLLLFVHLQKKRTTDLPTLVSQLLNYTKLREEDNVVLSIINGLPKLRDDGEGCDNVGDFGANGTEEIDVMEMMNDFPTIAESLHRTKVHAIVSNHTNCNDKLDENKLAKEGAKLKSYVNTVCENMVYNKLKLIPIGTSDGREVVMFDDEILQEGIKKWQLTLCGQFVGYKMAFAELRFRDEEGMNHVLESGPWMADKEFKERIEICYKSSENQNGGFSKFVGIEYSWKPPMCNICKVFGHHNDKCGQAQKNGIGEKAQGNNGHGFMRNTFGGLKQKKVDGKGLNSNQFNRAASKDTSTGDDLRNKQNSGSKVRGGNLGDTELSEDYRPNGTEIMDKYEKKCHDGYMDEEDVCKGEHGMAKIITENVVTSLNVRGMYNKETQKKVKKFICDEKLSICATLETHIKPNQIDRISSKVFGRWSWFSNLNESKRGCIIIVAWNLEDVIVTQTKFFCCFIYAANTGRERKELWKDLYRYKRIVDDNPWVLMGDWNLSLNNDDHSEGGSCKTADMIDFQECIEKIKIEDLKRFMGNNSFIGRFCNTTAYFLPHLSSDHCPTVLIMPKTLNKKKRAFRFANFIADKPEFLGVVDKEWNIETDGCEMYKLVKKLKAMKFHMKKLSWKNRNLFERVECWKDKLIQVDKDSHNAALKVEEANTIKEYNNAMKDEEKFLYQQAKITWMSDGDKNSKFFHAVIKGKMHRNRIDLVCDEKGDTFEGLEVAEQFVKHFQNFLGRSTHVEPLIPNTLNVNKSLWKMLLLWSKRPKKEGGLGIKNLNVWNEVLMAKHLWNIACNKESLRVKWINVVRLKGTSIWEVKTNNNTSCGWKQILRLRSKMIPNIKCEVSNEENVFLWHDRWWEGGVLSNSIPFESLTGANSNTKLCEMICNGEWKWPETWTRKYPLLNNIHVPNMVDCEDRTVWENNDGEKVKFLINTMLKDWVQTDEKVAWYKVLWFSQCSPKHSFILWLTVMKRLSTQDRIIKWCGN
ncbi:RNA-directed DNA polymerase, eukaryota, reverse transcriptase zinc-binding domain protein [Tanacetum coccineum]